MPLHRHLISICSLVYGLLNLTFWCLPLFLLTVIRLLVPPAAGVIRKATDAIYRAAVRCNDGWFRHVLRYRWQPLVPDLDPETPCIVVSNHQSWADSFLIQTAVVHTGPILKVLVKQQLMWIPPLALIFWAYDFPRLKRRARREQEEADRRKEDSRRVQEACQALKRSPGAMLLYPEGTRFTEQKRGANSLYRHLLPPRPGGFAMLLDGLQGSTPVVVLDFSIIYPDTTSFWSFLSGGVREPRLFSYVTTSNEIEDSGAWLAARWQEKDRLLDESSAEPDEGDNSRNYITTEEAHTSRR